MSGLWDRVKAGFSRTDTVIERMKAEGKTGPVAPLRAPPKQEKVEPAEPITPWTQLNNEKVKIRAPPPTELWMQSPFVRGSAQKMNLLARQIIGLPLDAALLQMHFSPKKFAQQVGLVLSRLKGTLLRQGANAAEYYIRSATVGRGVYIKRLEIRGRGKHGIQWRGNAFIRVCAHKPEPKGLVRKMLKIKKIPREDRPVMKKLDYY